MSETCEHTADVRDVTPSALGCEECLKMGSKWVHLRLCRTCGHVGCCENSPNKHATAHFHGEAHPIIQSYEPGEDWYYCYVDELAFELDEPGPRQGAYRVQLLGEIVADANADSRASSRTA